MTLAELQKLIADSKGEWEQIEFKSTTGDLHGGMETLCAFLNGLGGKVLFGVTTAGKTNGQDVTDKTFQEIANAIRKLEPPAQITQVRIPVSGTKEVVMLATTENAQATYIFDGRPYWRIGNTTSLMPQVEYERRLLARTKSQQRQESEVAENSLSTADAVASLLKFIAEDRYNVQLHRLLSAEGERVYAALTAFNKELLARSIQFSDIPAIYSQYRDITATLLELFVHGCFWSRPETDAFFVSTLQQVCRSPKIVSGPALNDGFTHYPAVLVLYAGGLASLLSARPGDLLAKLFYKPTIRDIQQSHPLVAGLDWSNLIGFAKAEFPTERKYAPFSEHMFLTQRKPLGQYAPDDGQYDDIFDRYEYFQALVVADLGSKVQGVPLWGPMGRFAWKARSRMSKDTIIRQIDDEIDAMQGNWPPLKVGLFGGSFERLKATRDEIRRLIGRLEWY